MRRILTIINPIPFLTSTHCKAALRIGKLGTCVCRIVFLKYSILLLIRVKINVFDKNYTLKSLMKMNQITILAKKY